MFLRLFRYRRPRIGNALFSRRAVLIRLFFHAGQGGRAFFFQKAHHTPADAMDGKQAERDAPAMIITLHRFNEANGSLLNDIHNDIESSIRQGIFKNEGLVRGNERAPRLGVAVFLKSTPKSRFLRRRQNLDFIQFLQVFL